MLSVPVSTLFPFGVKEVGQVCFGGELFVSYFLVFNLRGLPRVHEWGTVLVSSSPAAVTGC